VCDLSHKDEVPEMLVVCLLSTLRDDRHHYSHHDVIVDPDEIVNIRSIYQYVEPDIRPPVYVLGTPSYLMPVSLILPLSQKSFISFR